MKTAKEHNDYLVGILREWQLAYLGLRATSQTPLQHVELTVKSELLRDLGQILGELRFEEPLQNATQPSEQPQPEASGATDAEMAQNTSSED
mgnify:CR=1 FL=1